MAASDARPYPQKNAAFRYPFAIRKNDGTLITTWAGMDSEVSVDQGSFAACTNEATEIGTSGCGYIDLTSAEMNGDSVMLKVTLTNTGALPLVVTFFPQESGDISVRLEGTTHTGAVIPTVTTTGSVVGAVGSVTGAVGSVTAPVAITSNVKKNAALAAFGFVMTDSTTHAPKTGVTVTATRSLDGGAFAACANAPAEIANGAYKIDLAAADMNANVVILKFTGADSDDLLVTLVTQP